jgi:hypothetical protein
MHPQISYTQQSEVKKRKFTSGFDIRSTMTKPNKLKSTNNPTTTICSSLQSPHKETPFSPLKHIAKNQETQIF